MLNLSCMTFHSADTRRIEWHDPRGTVRLSWNFHNDTFYRFREIFNKVTIKKKQNYKVTNIFNALWLVVVFISAMFVSYLIYVIRIIKLLPKSGALCDGDVLLFVCSFVCSFVCWINAFNKCQMEPVTVLHSQLFGCEQFQDGLRTCLFGTNIWLYFTLSLLHAPYL